MATILEQLEAYSPQDRPAAVVHAMRQLARRAGHDLIVISELAHEAHEQAYWSKVNREDGSPYLTEEEFFSEVLQLTSWRSATKRIGIGKKLAALPEEARALMRTRLAEIGAAKASIIAPVMDRPAEEVETWVERAERMTADRLQSAVSDATGVKPRGATVNGDRVRTFLLNAAPSLEARAVLEEFFDLGLKCGAGETTMGVLLAGAMECLGTWRRETS